MFPTMASIETQRNRLDLKCSYSQKLFLGFSISITSKNALKHKKVNSDTFSREIKLQISRFKARF